MLHYIPYESELQLPPIVALIQNDLSEPYSIYTYRYFIHNWPQLCFLVVDDGDNKGLDHGGDRTTTVGEGPGEEAGKKVVGVVVCKLDTHHDRRRGYIAMLAVSKSHRKLGIGSALVEKAVAAMQAEEADEVVLETEETNKGALALYQNLGFVRDKRMERYYLNGVDAFRLKLWLK
ncbi:putative acyltransfersase [Fimicolochytrium jonesii]|uniref:putative acyltransfersase n=1 Tax=Fimicolochytrium jonesii TaxID=1396493 RepID=UPI0022FE47D0|nr:putative acyltransfersase [Fimicolochytrium jonesii]KAI8820581.1 putative acyltransfersase [Fimicolochytrium jonesii]